MGTEEGTGHDRESPQYHEALKDITSYVSRTNMDLALFPGTSATKLSEEIKAEAEKARLPLPPFKVTDTQTSRNLYVRSPERCAQYIRAIIPEGQSVLVVEDISVYGGKLKGLREGLRAARIPAKFAVLAAQTKIDDPDVYVIRPNSSFLVDLLRKKFK